MDDLKAAAMCFNNLLNTKYRIILGKRGRLTEFNITFQKEDFFHLIGLQYLKDLPILKRSSTIIFDKILSDDISLTTIKKSQFYDSVQQRICDFKLFETLLDNNDLIFKYTKNRSYFSNITADYLLITKHQSRTGHIFIGRLNDESSMSCRSFFFNDHNNYSEHQVKMTLLYKEKISCDTGKSVIQFNKLYK